MHLLSGMILRVDKKDKCPDILGVFVSIMFFFTVSSIIMLKIWILIKTKSFSKVPWSHQGYFHEAPGHPLRGLLVIWKNMNR